MAGNDKLLLAPLPTPGNPRWWVPVSHGRMLSNSLDVYVPYARLGRLTKAIFVESLSRWGGAALLPGKKPAVDFAVSRLEAVLEGVFGTRNLAFSVSAGCPGRFQKTTYQIMRLDGEILGYLKIANSEGACERIRNEAVTLRRLRERCGGTIPELLHEGEECGMAFLLTEPGPNCAGPADLDRRHFEFLERLNPEEDRNRFADSLLAQLEGRLIGGEGADLDFWSGCLDWATKKLRGVQVRFGWSHGDFAPWNTKVGENGLFVFDWERGTEDAPVLWDVMHFMVQTASSLGKPWRPEPPSGLGHDVSDEAWYGLLAAYCVNSAMDLSAENSPDIERAVGFRRRVLKGLCI